VLPFVLPDLKDLDDRRMVQVGGGLSFGVEPPDLGLVGELAAEDHLEGHGPVEADLPGLEHYAHASAGHLSGDLVIAEGADTHQVRRIGIGSRAGVGLHRDR
jgi:hypothetical protein